MFDISYHRTGDVLPAGAIRQMVRTSLIRDEWHRTFSNCAAVLSAPVSRLRVTIKPHRARLETPLIPT
jgi:hypothetical protein